MAAESVTHRVLKRALQGATAEPLGFFENIEACYAM
jgi:hypothetical protein